MGFDPGMLIDAVLVVLGCLWCREMAGRARKDLVELRTSKDPSMRWVILGLWILTGLVFLFLLNFVYVLLRRFGVF